MRGDGPGKRQWFEAGSTPEEVVDIAELYVVSPLVETRHVHTVWVQRRRDWPEAEEEVRIHLRMGTEVSRATRYKSGTKVSDTHRDEAWVEYDQHATVEDVDGGGVDAREALHGLLH
jgi:hypothetical protein